MAKVNLRKSEACEYLSDITCYEADQARRDRLVTDEHFHNQIQYPKITVTKEEVNPAAPELGSLTPSNRTIAKKAATKQWNQENPNRPLVYGLQGEDCPIIVDSSSDPSEDPHLPPLPPTPPRKETEEEEMLPYRVVQ